MSSNKCCKIKLSDLLNFRRGHDLPKTEMNIGKIPVIGSNGIIGTHNEFTTKAPCLTIGRSGNIGNPCYIDTDCWAHNTTLYVDDFKGNNPKYLYYLLKTLNLAYYGGGSAVPTLNRNHIHPVEVEATLNIIEQKAIAATLSCLDDKIELNNCINKTLGKMAQAIFRSWFVDFEPFQDSEFEDSELGRIPKGWRVGSIGEVANITSGKRPPLKQEYSSTEIHIPVVGASSIMAYTNEKLFNEKILITGRVGTHGIIQRFNTPCWPSDNTLVIKSEYYEFMYQILNCVDYKLMNRGSTQPLITQTDLKNIRIIIPTEPVINDFETLTLEIMTFWNENKNQNNTLIEARDTLLPKLMSGEIRVPIEEVQ
ncbi:MAG TPA: restriction endonuclease subunit S [Clostridiales bacterium]|nr:restriction endonuclease subunit S [Clostridiales bacterium]